MDLDDILSPGFLIPVAGGFVVLLGIVIAVVTIMLGKKKKARVEQWGRAAYSIWTGGEDSATWAPARAQKALRDWYGANSGAQAQDTIRSVARGQTGNAAWDKVRALDIARIALAASYIDADQCRVETARIGRELQKQFRGWEDLAQSFEAGMQKWQHSSGVTKQEELGRVQKNLPTLRGQIWPSIPWSTKLAVSDD